MTCMMRDPQEISKELVGAGFFSCDCYSDHFEPLGNFSAVYLFLARSLEVSRSGPVFVAYVGMSKNLRVRMHSHEVRRDIHASGYWPQRWFCRVDVEKLREQERFWIRHFSPPWNTVGLPSGADRLIEKQWRA